MSKIEPMFFMTRTSHIRLRWDTSRMMMDRFSALFPLCKQRNNRMKPNSEDYACGQHGACLLRSLRSFRVGQSFTTDSLHNIYSGVIVRDPLFT